MSEKIDTLRTGGLDPVDSVGLRGAVAEVAGVASRFSTWIFLGMTAVIYGDQLTGSHMEPSDIAHLSGAARFAAIGTVVAGAVDFWARNPR